MEFDYLIIGGGIQGLILLDRMRALGLNVCCVERAADVGSGQTLRSQFYVHRGHFYTERDLIWQLNDGYPMWQRIVHRLGVRIRSTRSYIGFTGDSGAWTDAWDSQDVPYTHATGKSAVLEGHRLAEVFTFPHMLIDGREFVAKLSDANRHLIRLGEIGSIMRSNRGYRFTLNGQAMSTRKIVVCAGAGTPSVLSGIDGLDRKVEVQTRLCQVLVMRGKLPNESVLVPDAQMFIAPQYNPDGSPVLLYTYGTDPVDAGNGDALDMERIARQVDALNRTLPALGAAAASGDVYLARKTESAMLGRGLRPNKAFVERVADDVLCVLPTKLSLAINAADEVLAKLGIQHRKQPEPVPVGVPPHYLVNHAVNAFRRAQHAVLNHAATTHRGAQHA
ncbi:FAD-binding oxidoreductase [Burkholderia dolosa]|uniref:FAD-dependent oxidoreductase n=1 Tax=Burkholderia dolosa TaxID=152500 RepID=UPI001BA0C237|nr:FAD-binding oxidoreductase [Burkholderia dolosa]